MKKRGPYHHGHLRDALIQTARDVIETSGESSLSLRGCARALDVDVAAVYRHFRKKEEVLAAVAADGFAQLGQEMHQHMKRVGRHEHSAERYFFACGTSYVRFGIRHAHMYRLMFGGHIQAVDIQKQKDLIPVERTQDASWLLGDALNLLVETSVLDADARVGAETMAWSLVHGIITLHIDGRVTLDALSIQAQVERACRLLIYGLPLASP